MIDEQVIKADVVQKMAERLKTEYYLCDGSCDVMWLIDQTAKEILEEQQDDKIHYPVVNAAPRKEAEDWQSEWISVEERLPDRRGIYLVFTCDNRISTCHFDDYYCDGNMQFDDYKVTHWMPLPKPPKNKQERQRKL